AEIDLVDSVGGYRRHDSIKNSSSGRLRRVSLEEPGNHFRIRAGGLDEFGFGRGFAAWIDF
ncbi:MAG: hypothetical protein ACLQMG_21225, partial [Terracidiphilus sp.]